MGIPLPLWIWTNDIIAMQRKLGIHRSEIIDAVNKLAVNLYEKGLDVRFNITQNQKIPIF